jgi:hypothetical protein
MTLIDKLLGKKIKKIEADATIEVKEAVASVESAVAEVTENEDATKEAVTKEIVQEQPSEDQVDTVPLGFDENNSLKEHHYETIKDKFSQTFVIEKAFWAHTHNPEHGHKHIKVKRVAELKAASFLHALTMIGWDAKNVTLIEVKDEYKGEIEVQIDGKKIGICNVGISNDFNQLSNGARNVFVANLAKNVIETGPLVKEFIEKNNRKITGWAYEHRKHLNLKTAKKESNKQKQARLEAEEAKKKAAESNPPIQIVELEATAVGQGNLTAE